MNLPFVTLDVFTQTPFKGNPLAVVTIPYNLPQELSHEQKQAIAREFNLPETVFIHDIENRELKDRKIEIFLTNMEVSFAGHPTIGAAAFLLSQDVNTLICKAGPIAITRTSDKVLKAYIPHNIHFHKKRLRDLADLDPRELSKDATVHQAELDADVVSIVNGMNFILVELPSLADLARVEQIGLDISPESLLDDGWKTGYLARYFFVRTHRQVLPGRPISTRVRTRVSKAASESPATGSAACCLASYLSIKGELEVGPTHKFEVTQGVEMGRESNMEVEIVLKDASRIASVSLAGSAVQIMSGSLTI